jgi:hypothetical protein
MEYYLLLKMGEGNETWNMDEPQEYYEEYYAQWKKQRKQKD